MGAPMGNRNAAGRRGGSHKALIHSLSKISRGKNARWNLGAIHHIAKTSSLSSHRAVARYIQIKYKFS